MFLSMFSHQGFLHLFFNMYVLKWVAIELLGPAQFMAMYLSGGVFSVLFSLCHRALTAPAIWSLGASGANCALIGYFCAMLSPEQLVLHIVFLPMFPFSPKGVCGPRP
uniref:rhomboid protease n=1 Tax=Globodera pallida TaxID=36090 RepID=A0A183CRP8_GLOPA